MGDVPCYILIVNMLCSCWHTIAELKNRGRTSRLLQGYGEALLSRDRGCTYRDMIST